MNKANETQASRFLRLRRWLFGTSLGRVTTLVIVALGLTGVGVLGWLTLPLVISPTVDEGLPSDAGEQLFSGEFVGSDDFHRSSGAATIYEGAEGSHILRFEDFSVTNGPRLVVWLSDLTELTGIRPDVGSAPENYFHLQSLIAPNGDQNYRIPATVDPSRYNSVLIWCDPFDIAFAIAPLTPSG